MTNIPLFIKALFLRIIPLGFLFSLVVFYTFLLSLLTGDFRRTFRWHCGFWARVILKIMKFKVTVKGQPLSSLKTPCLVTANYQHSIDNFIMIGILPINIYLSAEGFLFKMPIFGWGLKKASYIPLSSSDLLHLKTGFDKIEQALKQKKGIFLFLSSGPSDQAKMIGSQKGVAYLGLKHNIPIYPIAINGSYKMKGQSFPRLFEPRIEVTVNIGEAIRPGIGTDPSYLTSVIEDRIKQLL